MSRQQDGRCGTPIFGLLQNMERRRFVAELLGQVRRLSGHGHHDRSPGRDTCAHPFERLTQEGLAARQSGVLLGSVLPIDLTGQPAQSRAFAPGKHHRPCVRFDPRILSLAC